MYQNWHVTMVSPRAQTKLTLRIALHRFRACRLAVGLFSTIALYMCRARLAESTTVGALRDWTTLLRDVLQLAVYDCVNSEYEKEATHATYLNDGSC